MKTLPKILILSLFIFCLIGCGEQTNKAEDLSVQNDNSVEIIKNMYIISINPQAAITEDAATGEIISIVPLNEDAENCYQYLDSTGKDFSTVVCEMVDLCVADGYLNKENSYVNIVVTQYINEDESALEDNVDNIIENVTEKYNDTIVVIESKADNYKDASNNNTNSNEEIWIACPSCSDGRINCPVCGGDWEHGYQSVELCSNCDNGIIIEYEIKEVYNGTPCKICGDVGTVDDGMHGGERAECGECRGFAVAYTTYGDEASTGYNGDYHTYAFDNQEVAVENPCMVCNGTGYSGEILDEPCLNCSYGYLICPSCDGKGGWFIH